MGWFAYAAPSPSKEQVKVLWNMLQLYYKHANVPDILDSLTDEIINDDKTPQTGKKGRVAQVRYWLPFCNQVGWECCLGERAFDNIVHIDWFVDATYIDE